MEFLRLTPTYILLFIIFWSLSLWFFWRFLDWQYSMKRFSKSFNYRFAKQSFVFRNISFVIWSILLLIALLWPLWQIWNQSKWASSNVIFLVDLSKSMDAIDAKHDDLNISRLDKAKMLISDFVAKHKENTYALVWFAWDSIIISPFTWDTDQFLTYVSWLNSNIIPLGWSDLNKALNFSLSLIWSDRNWNVLLFSNWPEDLTENADTDSITKKYSKIEYKIFSIWVWTQKWSYIPAGVNFLGNPTFKLYNWEKVITKQNSDELIKIANSFDWKYMNWTESSDIENINSDLLSIKTWLKEIERKSNDIWYYFILGAFMFFVLWYFTPYKKRLWKK
ncbi:MAG: von Willebrand factor type A protein [uncultured bacterium (gcode 4)]|uniref:von Willebrand factor type A protein n=1 Tax=uncultured bacterium (gcode 4) TaxID=1234023 RepID=K2GXB0_9BACT|nr:MAG: von Willebrand factor type A protein [uncultured bacterium (gcode 4)]